MVQRASGDFGITPQNAPVLSQASGGLVSANVGAERTLRADPAIKDNTLHMILGSVEKLGQQQLSNSQEEAYLQGAAKVGQIDSEQQLEGNPITRDWAVAGYRDTSGKLRVADAESQLSADMVALREQSPEKMQEYLAKRRASLTPAMDGMSQAARKATFEQLLLSDRTAISTHTTEHMKFQIDQRDKAERSQWSVNSRAMDTASESAGKSSQEYTTAVSTAALQLQHIAENPVYQAGGTGSKMITQGLLEVLATGHTSLYTGVRDGGPPPGSDKPLLDYLDADQRMDLSKAYHKALEHQKEKIHLQAAVEDGNIEAGQKQGIETRTPAEFGAFAAQRVADGVWKTDGEITSRTNAYYTAKMKGDEESALTTAYTTNNTGTLSNLNKSMNDAVVAFRTTAAKNHIPLKDQYAMNVRAGEAGNTLAWKEAGSNMANSLAAVMGSDPKHPVPLEHRANVAAIVEQLHNFDVADKGMEKHLMLSGLPEAARLQLMSVNALTPTLGLDGAIAKARGIEERKATMTKSQLAAESASTAKQDKAMQGSISSSGTLFKILNTVASGYSLPYLDSMAESEARGVLTPNTTVLGQHPDPAVLIHAYETKANDAIMQEYNRLTLTHNELSADAKRSAAIVAVGSRTLKTPDGSVIFPYLADRKEYLGDTGAASKEQVAQALHDTYKSGEGERNLYTAERGVLSYKVYNKDGYVAGKDGIVKPGAILPALRRIQGQPLEAYKEQSGTGATMQMGDKKVQISGVNTAGVSDKFAYDFRRTMVGAEGYLKVPTADIGGSINKRTGNPVLTVGHGISDTNTFYPKPNADGSISAGAVHQAFYDATSEAMLYGSKIQSAMQLPGDNWGHVIAGITYQSGYGNVVKLPAYREFFTTIKQPSSTTEQVVDSFKKTPAYTMSGKSRQLTYEAQIRKAMKG